MFHFTFVQFHLHLDNDLQLDVHFLDFTMTYTSTLTCTSLQFHNFTLIAGLTSLNAWTLVHLNLENVCQLTYSQIDDTSPIILPNRAFPSKALSTSFSAILREILDSLGTIMRVYSTTAPHLSDSIKAEETKVRITSNQLHILSP